MDGVRQTERHPGRSFDAAAHLALAFLALIWGYSWIATKVATTDASPLAVALGRSTVGALALLATLALTGRSLRPTPFVPTLIFGLLQTTGFSLTMAIAVSIGGAGKASVLAYTMPLWLTLIAWPVLGERIRRRGWLALGLAAVGLGLVATPLRATSLAASALPVLTGLIWAASAVWVVRMRRAAPHDLLALTAWQFVWGALALAPFALVLPLAVRWTVPFVAAMGFLAVFATALGWVVWLFILSRVPASVAGLGSLATPVVGVAMAAVQLHEIPAPMELGGMACIVTALALNAVTSDGGERAS
jgi:drug/metabolite transporter (DMT)-like permease